MQCMQFDKIINTDIISIKQLKIHLKCFASGNLANLDCVGDETEDGSGPKKNREATQEVLAEFHPL